jgi:hypothetical protein
MILLLLACATPTESPPAAASIFVPLDNARLARRLSIDLRAKLPTDAELARAAEPGGLAELQETWLADPGLEEHLADLFAEEWVLRLDTLRIEPSEFALSDAEAYAFTRSFEDEPARLIAHVIANDRPFTEIVTADYTLANDLLLDLIPLEAEDPEDTATWKVARYTDGRPANGILATSGMWLRFHTTIFNYNRGRAAALSRLLLCNDIAGRPVVFQGVSDESTEGLQAAITTDPGCISCHASLDPLAATLFGFWPYEDMDGTELTTYHPEREMLATRLLGTEPAWFGTPVTAAAQLGPLVAADPRFPVCMARRATERWYGRPTTTADDAHVYALAGVLTSAWSYKDLIRAIVATEEYRAGALTDAATDAQRSAHPVARVLTPNTLADLVEDATGFRWRFQGAEQVDEDLTGYRALLGGADGESARQPWLEPSVGRSLAIGRLAQAAAARVVDQDLTLVAADRRLLFRNGVEPLELVAGTAAFEAECQALHRRLHGVEASAEELAAETALFTEVEALVGSEEAWASLVSIMIRDPLFWTY